MRPAKIRSRSDDTPPNRAPNARQRSRHETCTHARTHALIDLIENTPQKKVLLVGVILLLLAPAAHAGISDTPLPQFTPGKNAKHVFSVPMIYRSTSLATIFSCTSLDNSGPITVGVELFDQLGALQNDVVAGNGSTTGLTPGFTYSFAEAPIAGVVIDEVISGSPLGRGSARIVSTSTKILCTVEEVSTAGNPPTIFDTLNIVKKKAQKGD